MLLVARDDPLVRGYDIRWIEERSNARNQNVLADGYRLIGEADYARFTEVLDESIDRLFAQVLARPREEWKALMRFVEPFAI